MQGAESIRQRTSNVVSLLLIVAVAIVALVYFTTAVTTGDFLWFVPTFGERPGAIVVHCAGDVVAYAPGSTEFEALTASLNSDLSGVKNNPDVGITQETLVDYQSKNLIVEAIYPQPVRLHLTFRYGMFDALIYPVSGPHSEEGYVFGRRGDFLLTGVDIEDDNHLVAEMLRRFGYNWQDFGGCTRP